jgi:hypothetical protein
MYPCPMSHSPSVWSEGKSIESQRLLLGEKLAVAKALEAARVRDYERLTDENTSLTYRPALTFAFPVSLNKVLLTRAPPAPGDHYRLV